MPRNMFSTADLDTEGRKISNHSKRQVHRHTCLHGRREASWIFQLCCWY